jgi:hypothetical protein
MDLLADEWLLLLGSRGPRERVIAGELLRVQVLTARRTGHLIDLAQAPLRRDIEAKAKWGRWSRHACRCTRCGATEPLTSWQYALAFTPQDRERLALAWHEHDRAGGAYLWRCTGNEAVHGLATILGLEKEQEG